MDLSQARGQKLFKNLVKNSDLVMESYPLGAMVALYYRDVQRTGQGQCVDVAWYEVIFRIQGLIVVEYFKTGTVNERTGNVNLSSPLGDVYRCADGKSTTIG